MASAFRKVTNLTRGVAIAATLAIAALISSAPLTATQDASAVREALGAHHIEGTWRVLITLLNCQSGLPVAPAFPAMATFGREGTLITADGGLNPAARSAGHGSWRFLGPGMFEALSEAFLFTNGVRTGTQRIRQEIEILAGGSEFTSRVNSEVLDVNGHPVFAGCATSAGRRME